MNQHLHEIIDIDDSLHAISFYSQETTLVGIKAACALVDEIGSIEQLNGLDILSLLNIDGIHGEANDVEDYPDSKTYHLKNLLTESSVSISDVIIVKQQKKKF